MALKEFVLSGTAAMMSISVMHPVDTVKSRLQLQGEAVAADGKRNLPYRHGVFASLRTIAVNEGLRGLYRGIVPAYYLQFSVTGSRFAVFHIGRAIFSSMSSSNSTSTIGRDFVIAFSSGCVSGLLGSPWFAIKTRFQIFSSADHLKVGYQHQPNTMIKTIQAIMRESGFRGFFRGADAFIVRTTAFGTAQLVSYEAAKRLLSRISNDKVFGSSIAPFAQQVLASAIASACCVTAIIPFDFIAVRLMNQPIDPTTKKGMYYSSAFDCARKSIASEGPLVLLKGAKAQYIRMIPYVILTLVFLEELRILFPNPPQNASGSKTPS